MRIGYIYFFENPGTRHHLRRINEARSAAIYGAVRGAAEAVGALAARLGAELKARLAEHATRRALSRLSDATLRDIGLNRGEIAHVAREAARGPAEGAGQHPRLDPVPSTPRPAPARREAHPAPRPQPVRHAA